MLSPQFRWWLPLLAAWASVSCSLNPQPPLPGESENGPRVPTSGGAGGSGQAAGVPPETTKNGGASGGGIGGGAGSGVLPSAMDSQAGQGGQSGEGGDGGA